jgi:hypothetical protein
MSPLDFVPSPSSIKIPANGQTILNIGAKLKNSYQLANINNNTEPSKIKAEKYNHLLIAKIKDT